MSVCVYSVFVLPCAQVVAFRRADPPSEDECVNDQKTEKAVKVQQKAVEPYIDRYESGKNLRINAKVRIRADKYGQSLISAPVKLTMCLG
jgi:hypothetical protein